MNIIDWKLFRVPALVFPLLLVISFVSLSQYADDEIANSVLASGILCMFHLVVGFIILEAAFEKSPTSFLKRVLGGMGLRLSVMLIVLFFLIGMDSVDDTWLLLGLLGWYAIALGFEIMALQRKVASRQQIDRNV
jgi:hypothetical protein